MGQGLLLTFHKHLQGAGGAGQPERHYRDSALPSSETLPGAPPPPAAVAKSHMLLLLFLLINPPQTTLLTAKLLLPYMNWSQLGCRTSEASALLVLGLGPAGASKRRCNPQTRLNIGCLSTQQWPFWEFFIVWLLWGGGGTIRIEMAAFPRRITPRRLSKRSSIQFGKKTATEFSSGHTRQILSDDILNVTFNGAPVQAGLHALRLGRGRPFPVLAGNQKDKGVKGGLFQL